MLIGIVGKPSSGKSTFFKAATLAEVEISERPFTTIKPNHAISYVKVECVDKEFNVQCNPREGYCLNHIRFVPVELLDVAGLIPGSHEGAGLGLSFLDDLRQGDALIHIVDISGSTNEKGEKIPALSYDPLNDVKFLEYEIDMWFLSILKKGWDKFAKITAMEKKSIVKEIASQFSGLKITESMVDIVIKKLNLPSNLITWSESQLKQFCAQLRLLSEPMIIAANKIDVPGSEKNLERLKKEFPNYLVIPCSAESELALREAAKKELISYIPGSSEFKILKESSLSEQQKSALSFIKENILKKYGSTGIQEILDSTIFKFLKYIAIFPGGVNKLSDQYGRIIPDCYLMKEGSTALDFAYKLHTDFGKNFIKAVNVRKKLPVGKDYKLQHRDVIEIIAAK